MSFKSKLLKNSLFKGTVKLGIKLTPKILVAGVANVVLKGIAKFSKISFDLNKRTAFVNVTLYGEDEPIEVTIEGFEILEEKGNYKFILHNAQSNKPWMTNIFARIIGKEWVVPAIPQFKDEIDFVADLLKVDQPKQVAVKKTEKKIVEKTKQKAQKPVETPEKDVAQTQTPKQETAKVPEKKETEIPKEEIIKSAETKETISSGKETIKNPKE